MKKIKLLFFCCLLYVSAANAQEKFSRASMDLGMGINQFLPEVADSLRNNYTNSSIDFSRNILIRFNVNLSYKYSLQIGGNFVGGQSSMKSKLTSYTYTQKVNAQFLTVKICNYLLDSIQNGFNVYWNFGVLYTNAIYNIVQSSPNPIGGDKGISNSNYLPSVGLEGAIGFRLKSKNVGIFVEAGLNKLGDKARAVVQGGISFYIK